MKPETGAIPGQRTPAHPDQPPSSQQTNSSARPAQAAPDAEMPTDSGTAAQRTMKQTSKTVQESGKDVE